MLLPGDSQILKVILASAAVYMLAAFIIKKVSEQRKRRILKQYKVLRKQSLELQEALSQCLLSEKATDVTLHGEMTYNDFYRQLKSNHIYNLSDKYLSKVKNSNNLLFLSKAERNLQEQEQKLKDAEQLLTGSLVLQ